MGVSTVHVCGRGRGATSVQIVTLRCDTDGCHASVEASSRPAYDEVLAAGWRREGKFGAACPDHSGATPTVPVQQELGL